jgi:ABC-type bacteriocin/lantibiotic exporter with double-glycine peptidase domain
MGPLVSVYRIFTASERARLGSLVLLIAVAGFLEVFGVGVLFPYVVILQDPGRIAQMPYLGTLYRWLNVGSDQAFIMAMSAGLLGVFCFKALFTVLVANYQLKFVNDLQAQLGRRLLARYIKGPYEFFLTANTSTLLANIMTSIGQLCSGVVQSGLMLAAELVSFVGLITFLVWLDPFFSLIAFAFTGVLALAFVGIIRKKVAHHAKENDARWKGMIRKVNESLNAAKEIQILGRAQHFVDAFSREARGYAFAVRRYSLLSQLPRIGLETCAVAMLVAFAVFTIASNRAGADLFPVLAVFAAATIRIIPSINRIIQGWNTISFLKPSISIVVAGLGSRPDNAENAEATGPAISFHRDLKLSVKSFSYGGNPLFQLKDLALTVEQGEKIAIVGHSGSGKSTLMDLMLGLFPAFDGSLVVDGVDCRGRETAWQRSIGYVPQTVYLLDDSIRRNVAFGIEVRDIDPAAVMRAVSLAGLERVVKTQAAGLETVIGDRGIRLSGGERQRIGIARALYHDPALLILDEATSALDNQTERQVVDSILALSPTKTVIIIAHRLSSVRLCDRVCLMNAGRIVDTGSFDEIATRHPDFVNPRSTLGEEARAQATSLLDAGPSRPS